MRASIVIPAYNEEAFIAATLIAATAQEHDDFEVIVVDNASSDRTAALVGAFPEVKLVQEPRRGLLYAREAGRRAADGEVIAHLDADCLPDPGWLARGLRHFARREVVAVTGPYRYHDAGLGLRLAAAAVQKVGFKALHAVGHDLIGGGVVFMGGNALIRAESLAIIGGYDTAIAFYGEDTDTGRRLAEVGRVLYRNELTIASSGRRFRRLGLARTIAKYAANYVSVLWHKRPYHAEID